MKTPTYAISIYETPKARGKLFVYNLRRASRDSQIVFSQMISSRILHKNTHIFQTVNEALADAVHEEKSPPRKICSFVVNGRLAVQNITHCEIGTQTDKVVGIFRNIFISVVFYSWCFIFYWKV